MRCKPEQGPDGEIADDQQQEQLAPVRPGNGDLAKDEEQRHCSRQHHRCRHEHPAKHVEKGRQNDFAVRHDTAKRGSETELGPAAVIQIAAVGTELPEPKRDPHQRDQPRHQQQKCLAVQAHAKLGH
jgi:hypothetical protein